MSADWRSDPAFSLQAPLLERDELVVRVAEGLMALVEGSEGRGARARRLLETMAAVGTREWARERREEVESALREAGWTLEGERILTGSELAGVAGEVFGGAKRA